jgi:hypothetical protein
MPGRRFRFWSTATSRSARVPRSSLISPQNYSTPEHALIPEEKSLQAKWLEWCFFIISERDSTSLYVMRRHRLNNGLAHLYGEAPGRIFSSSVATRRSRVVGWQDLPHGRSIHDSRHHSDDMPYLGNRLRRRNLQQRSALPVAHSRDLRTKWRRRRIHRGNERTTAMRYAPRRWGPLISCSTRPG